MPEVSAQDVAALRKKTGAGILDCKKALEESGGDMEAAQDWLRTKGLAGASKRAGRDAAEGAIDVVVTPQGAAIVELSCETDFVAKSDAFSGLVGELAIFVANNGEKKIAEQSFEGSTVGDVIAEMGAKVGENVALGRVVYYPASDGVTDSYKHVQSERGTIGVLVELTRVDGSDPKAQEVAHDLALHIASAAPRYVSRDQVPAGEIDKERAVLEELTRNEGKPEQAIPKIIEGRLNAFFKDTVLVEQPFVKDAGVTVGSLVEGLGPKAAVKRFDRIKIGEE